MSRSHLEKKSRVRKMKEPVPARRTETVRQSIAAFLEGPPAALRDISVSVGASEKEVVAHLEHLERSLPSRGKRMVVVPAECGKCGFVFRKRTRLRKPGRCPLCRHTAVHEPLFSIRSRGAGKYRKNV